MSKRAVIYARVSTDMQRDNFSIPTQIAECINYAKSKKYTLLGNQFVDPQTGRDVAADFPFAIPAYVDDFTSRELSRPSLDATIYFLEAYGFDVVIVHALDRLARDPYIRQTLEREFNKRGARVEYVLGGYDESPEGEVRKDLDATFAKWENTKRVERSLRGKYRKAQSGK
jgi:site-specific DNA recombinase